MSAVQDELQRLDELARRLCGRPLFDCTSSEMVALVTYLEALAADQAAVAARADAALSELRACGGAGCGIRIPQLPGGGDDPTGLRVQHSDSCGWWSS